MNITNIKKEDLSICLRIYQDGLKTGIASFQEPSITLDEFHKKIDLEKCLTLQINKKIEGYAFYTKVSNRFVYDGVGEVRLGGRRDRTIRINLMVDKMSSLNVTANDIVSAFNREHLQLPGGFLVKEQSEKMFKLDLEYHKVQELNELVVAYRNDGPVKIRDIAEVEDGLEEIY